MRRLFIVPVLLIASTLLGGCFHTQLNGSVGGTTVTVVDPALPNEIIYQDTSLSADAWRALLDEGVWDDYPGFTRLIFIGILPTQLSGLDPSKMYLVTASGGMENDAEGDLKLDSTPSPVRGEWHALVSGERLLAGNVKISALTETAYQQLAELVGVDNSASLQAQLDALAATLVDDVDGDQVIDYADVLGWNRTFNAANFTGDINAVTSLGEAIIEGASANSIASLANSVVESAAAAGLSGTWRITEQVDGTQCEEGFYTDSYSLTVTQSGNTLQVNAPAGQFTGTLNGTMLDWSGSYAEDGGQTNTTISVRISGNSLNGSANWSWTDGDFSCSGTAQISGVRTGG